MLEQAIARNRKRWARYRAAQRAYDKLLAMRDRGVTAAQWSRMVDLMDRLEITLEPLWRAHWERRADRARRIGR